MFFFILKCLLALADLRDYHGFEHKYLLDKTFGTAVRVMGPKVVLAAVRLSSRPSRSVTGVLPVRFGCRLFQHSQCLISSF